MIIKKKKFGQHFLLNEDIARREIEYCNISKNDIVLEVGPGKGILTKILLLNAKKVIAVEIDKKLYENLKKTIKNKNIILINIDILKIDLNNIPKFNKIVSNLPFKISLPITLKFLEYKFEKAVLIYQKEFAERMIAKAGGKNYSRLSVLIYYKSFCKIIENIPKENFIPIPKVDSSIVELKPRIKPPFYLKNELFYFYLTKILFNNKRKKIQNIIKKFYKLNNINIPFKDDRIEELSPEEIGELSNILFDQIRYKV
jgi:16S rRNA (adenine1518-N6/adenine1519-N6)-dimethyltransferase